MTFEMAVDDVEMAVEMASTTSRWRSITRAKLVDVAGSFPSFGAGNFVEVDQTPALPADTSKPRVRFGGRA